MKAIFRLFLLPALVSAACAGNVIFVHPDGAGIAYWQAARFVMAGPDGEINWDKIPHTAVYRGHMKDNLTATSNGGATSHAYGVKTSVTGFGSDGRTAEPLRAAGGAKESLMQEAKRRGLKVGVVNSGSVIEPGTAAFLASVAQRNQSEEITRQVVESGADVIMSGGEEWFLPEGEKGRHGSPGLRKDGRDLIALAREKGYAVVFDREELSALPSDTKKILGIFAAQHTFNDQTEAELAENGLPLYATGAPTLGEMTARALQCLSPGPFFLVVEEEGTDNFGNANNGRGVLEALSRADQALGVALDYVENNPNTLLLTAADSDAGGMDVIGLTAGEHPPSLAQGRDANGAPYSLGTDGKPFRSAPDREGVTHDFILTWAARGDVSGGIVVRAAGKNAELVRGSFDNTKIYEVMRQTLWETPEDESPAKP